MQNVFPITVTLVNKSTVTLIQTGDMIIEIKGKTGNTHNPVINKITLQNVYYYANLNFLLIS